VRFHGSKVAPTVSHSQCARVAGVLDLNGAGLLTYECTFASADQANVTLTFNATGLIPGGLLADTLLFKT